MAITGTCSTDVEKTSTKPPNFFVTGLPRSRTAWFSDFLPHCLYEGMEGCYSIDEYLKKLGPCGDSSSLLAFFPIDAYFPDAPIVIVERDIDDVISSLESINLMHDGAVSLLRQAKTHLDKMKGMRIDFEDLSSLTVIEFIWNHLIGTEFDEKRAIEFQMKNIQKVNRKPNVDAMVTFIGGA